MNEQLQTLAHWKGSEQTAEAVRKEIVRRWGEQEAESYDPLINCFTYSTWWKLGYYVKRGEKAIRSVTYVEVKERNNRGEEVVVKTYPKPVYLFYILQVDKRQ